MPPEPEPAARADESASRFETIVCGIDSSPQSTVALEQGIALAEERATIWATAAWDPRLAMHAGIHASDVTEDLRREAVGALKEAEKRFPSLQPMLIKGPDVASLLAAAGNLQCDLLSVGSHGNSRTAGILFGSVATAMVHHAPCPVLVAREHGGRRFPGLVLHAGDGSQDSLDAARIAGAIAARHDVGVATLLVGEGREGRRGAAEEAAAIIEACGREPVIMLESGSPHRRIVEAATRIEASLILIGSRGLSGLKALGSVSEQVAHRAPCSVLVARPRTPPVEDALA